jgi:hypothetical protein
MWYKHHSSYSSQKTNGIGTWGKTNGRINRASCPHLKLCRSLGENKWKKNGPHALTSCCADPFVPVVWVVGDCESDVLPLSLGGSSQGTWSTALWIYHTTTMAERERERGMRELCDGEWIGGEESREELRR